MRKKILISLVILVVLGGAIMTGTILYGFRVMSLSAASMANTILAGEKVAVTKFYGEIKRGDLIVFKWPKNPEILYLKRIIGLPGETIEVRGKQVFINGQELSEKRVKVDLTADDPNANKPLQELAEEGAGEYRVFYDKVNWEGGDTDDHGHEICREVSISNPTRAVFYAGRFARQQHGQSFLGDSIPRCHRQQSLHDLQFPSS